MRALKKIPPVPQTVFESVLEKYSEKNSSELFESHFPKKGVNGWVWIVCNTHRDFPLKGLQQPLTIRRLEVNTDTVTIMRVTRLFLFFLKNCSFSLIKLLYLCNMYIYKSSTAISLRLRQTVRQSCVSIESSLFVDQLPVWQTYVNKTLKSWDVRNTEWRQKK